MLIKIDLQKKWRKLSLIFWILNLYIIFPSGGQGRHIIFYINKVDNIHESETPQIIQNIFYKTRQIAMK